MKITVEKNLRNFEFWAGAKDTAFYLTFAELDTIEEHLEELYPEGMTETEINDLFWFEEDFIAELLGFDSFDEIIERENEE